MSVSPNIIHVESPYLMRNLKQKIQEKLIEMAWQVESLNDEKALFLLQGRMEGMRLALNILIELEEKDGSARKAKDI